MTTTILQYYLHIVLNLRETLNLCDQMGAKVSLTLRFQPTPPLCAFYNTSISLLASVQYFTAPNIVVSQALLLLQGRTAKTKSGRASDTFQPKLQMRKDSTQSAWLHSLRLIHCLPSSVPAVIVVLCHLEVGGDGLPQPLAHQRVVWLGSLPPEDHRPRRNIRLE